MSIKIGNNILAKSSTYHPDLFDIKWSDHIINNISWLRADTFSWHSGELYNRAYEHLLEDYNNGTSKTDEIEGITIWYRETQDGHKITIINNGESEYREEAIARLYEKTGIAWYYIIDIDNRRFKLPRTKFAFEGVRTAVGNYIEPGLPNITGSFTGNIAAANFSGSFYDTGYRTWWGDNIHSNEPSGIGIDASKSNSIYGNSTTVQSPATEMYLYFYVGNYAQSDLENVAGEMSEVLNNKADIDLSNTLSNIDFVVESLSPTAENNYTWYRKYKSGWVEQGGLNIGNNTITLPIIMANNNYTLICALNHQDSNSLSITSYSRTTTNFYCHTTYQNSACNYSFSWQVSGIAAE